MAAKRLCKRYCNALRAAGTPCPLCPWCDQCEWLVSLYGGTHGR